MTREGYWLNHFPVMLNYLYLMRVQSAYRTCSSWFAAQLGIIMKQGHIGS